MRLPALLACACLLPAVEPVLTVPRAAVAPLVTADPADPAWAGVPAIALGPVENPTPGASLPPTTVQAQWLPEALHLRFACRDDEIHAPIRGRDAMLYQADAVEAFIDPVGDGRAVYEFQVSPNADLFDQLILCTAPEMRWQADGIWAVPPHETWFLLEWNNRSGMRVAAKAAALPDGPGWLADLAIPAEVLQRSGRKAFAPGTLRAHLVRVDHQAGADGKRLFATATLAPYPNGNPHRTAARMARLELAAGR